MKSAVYMDGVRHKAEKFELEDDFEKLVVQNSKHLFGKKTIYLDVKKKIDSRSFGGAVPDGVMFDLSDKEDIKFYLVEVELVKHSFNNHIFPQITKFFAFYKNPTSMNSIVDKLHSFIRERPEVYEEFKQLLGKKELYKSIKDAVENNFNILIVLDDRMVEIDEIQEVYTDTWDKLVIVEVLKVYNSDKNQILTLTPAFEEADIMEAEAGKKKDYTELYHLENSDGSTVQIYSKIKRFMYDLDPEVEFNPQKYYVSMRKNKNFAYIRIKKTKLRIVIPLVYAEWKGKLNSKIKQLSQSVQTYYFHKSKPSFDMIIEDDKNLDEVFKLLKLAYEQG